MPIARVLVANRGEIACRIIRTCRRLGIESVAVFSSADRAARHTRMADQAFAIGGAAPTDSYLNATALIDAAQRAGADAVHPGYGFLSENAAFVRGCTDAGLVFVGPDAATIEQMGSKAQAKATMQAAGVAVVPGYHGADQSSQALIDAAVETGFPLMIKAAAGGGGKGMRIVRSADELESALSSARREAKSAFGDDRVILERYIERPRHLEVQVFGDRHGNIVHLFERDCSTQRRYQKIIEECPAPGLTVAQRSALCEAGVAAARAVQYVGAGTVEFIADSEGRFFFMEMNTRLQVEHPVTEAVTGLDLVAWQLMVAGGMPLPRDQQQIQCTGHAIEARIYAEDPDNGFLPSTGTLDWLQFPDDCRVESGVQQGDEVSVHYDPMLAKLIVHADCRADAVALLARQLRATRLAGVRCNLPFLCQLIAGEVFLAGTMHTAFLDARGKSLQTNAQPPSQALVAALIIELLNQEDSSRQRQQQTADPSSPWGITDAFRLAHSGKRRVALAYRGLLLESDAWGHGGNYRLRHGEQVTEVRNARRDGQNLSWLAGDTMIRVTVADQAPYIHVGSGAHWCLFRSRDPFAVELTEAPADHRILAPMPGRIVVIRAREGDHVATNDELLVMEAMKMELSLRAPMAGRVAQLRHVAGDFVEADTLLVEIEPESA